MLTSVLRIAFEAIPVSLAVGIMGPIASAGTAVAVVALTHHFTQKRDQGQREHEEHQQQASQERQAIGNLIAVIHPWQMALNTMFLAVYFDRNDPAREMGPEARKRSRESIHRFTAALWEARMTVRNPLARPTLDRLRDLHHELTDLIGAYERDRSKEPDLDQRISNLDSDVRGACSELEGALLDAPQTDVSH